MYQIKAECPNCKKFFYKEWPKDPQGGRTSYTCARCFTGLYEDDIKIKKDYSDVLNDLIVDELSGKIVWENDGQSPYAEGEPALYYEYLRKAKLERGEGSKFDNR